MKLASILINPRTFTLKTAGVDTEVLKTTVEFLLISLSLRQEMDFFLSYSNPQHKQIGFPHGNIVPICAAEAV